MTNNSMGAFAQSGENAIGAHETTFEFVIGTGSFATTITVSQTGTGGLIFRPVLISPIPDFSFETGDTVLIDISVHFQDITGTPLSFSASNLPAGLNINPASGIISGVIL